MESRRNNREFVNGKPKQHHYIYHKLLCAYGMCGPKCNGYRYRKSYTQCYRKQLNHLQRTNGYFNRNTIGTRRKLFLEHWKFKPKHQRHTFHHYDLHGELQFCGWVSFAECFRYNNGEPYPHNHRHQCYHLRRSIRNFERKYQYPRWHLHMEPRRNGGQFN